MAADGGVVRLIVTVCVLIHAVGAASHSFVQVQNGHLSVEGKRLYVNGFNAYWLMVIAYDPSQQYLISQVYREAASHGLNVARTWAFNDGGYRALQTSPGVYDEQAFKALDFVVNEASKHRIRLELSLANNYNEFGGKAQYVQWGQQYGGQNTNSEDDFFTNPTVKGYYKNHIEKILTRVNTINGKAYKDDPTIFAWELMNEARCQSDPSGNTLQGWIEEMAAYVKSIDRNHLLEIGTEGFYGDSTPDNKQQFNPPAAMQLGTDFVRNSQVKDVDIATVHSYPDQWLGGSSDIGAQQSFLIKWVKAHIEDAEQTIVKPVLFGEFGLSSKDSGYTISERDSLFGIVYDGIYEFASMRGFAAGGMFWQLLTHGITNDLSDGYEIYLSDSSSTVSLISAQSRRMSKLNG